MGEGFATKKLTNIGSMALFVASCAAPGVEQTTFSSGDAKKRGHAVELRQLIQDASTGADYQERIDNLRGLGFTEFFDEMLATVPEDTIEVDGVVVSNLNSGISENTELRDMMFAFESSYATIDDYLSDWDVNTNDITDDMLADYAGFTSGFLAENLLSESSLALSDRFDNAYLATMVNTGLYVSQLRERDVTRELGGLALPSAAGIRLALLDYPTCQAGATDTGSGFGFENGQSCRIATGAGAVSSDGFAYCQGTSATAGEWGFENGKSCRARSGLSQSGGTGAIAAISAGGSNLEHMSAMRSVTWYKRDYDGYVGDCVEKRQDKNIDVTSQIAVPEESTFFQGRCANNVVNGKNLPDCTKGQGYAAACGRTVTLSFNGKQERAYIGTFCPEEHADNIVKGAANPCPRGSKNVDISEELRHKLGLSDSNSYGGGEQAQIKVSY